MKTVELFLKYERALTAWREAPSSLTSEAAQRALTEFFEHAEQLERQNLHMAKLLGQVGES